MAAGTRQERVQLLQTEFAKGLAGCYIRPLLRRFVSQEGGVFFPCVELRRLVGLFSMARIKRKRARPTKGFSFCQIPLLISAMLIAPAQPQAQTRIPEHGHRADSSSEPSADAIYQRGMLLVQEKHYDEALSYFRLLHTQFPQSPQGLTGEGIVLALMGDPEKAINILKTALLVDPDYWLARRELGILYWSEGLRQEGAEALEPLVDLHPDDGPVNSILGQYELARKNYGKAVAYFSRVPAEMAADPNLALMGAEAQLHSSEKTRAEQTLKGLEGRPDLTAEVRFRLAWLLGQAGLSKQAVQEFNKLPPDYPDRFRRSYGLALAYFTEQDYQECIKTLKSLLGTGMTQPEIYSLVGVAEERSGHTQEAYQALREGILKNPANPQNYLNFATLASEHQNYELAAEVLTEALTRNPQAHELFLSRGIAYTLAARFAEAKQDYQRAIEMAPKDYGVYLAMGISEQETGNLDDAVRLFREATVHEPKDPRSYCFLTETLMQRGAVPGGSDFQEAQQSINTAISLEPNFAHGYADRAKLELAQGNTKKAIVDLEHARSADPKSRQIAYALARAYQRDGDKTKADRLFREVRSQSDEDAGQFAKDSLTETLAVVSGGPH
jgi:tetratricopeptide (TPR) repeat protein